MVKKLKYYPAIYLLNFEKESTERYLSSRGKLDPDEERVKVLISTEMCL